MYSMDQYTVVLLHFEEGIKDESGKVWEAKNGAAVTDETAVVGKKSLSLNGVNQYITTPKHADFAFGAEEDYTFDYWVYLNKDTDSYYIPFTSQAIGGISSTVGTRRISIGRSLIGDEVVTSVNIPAKKWTHISIVRYQGCVKFYVDGKNVGQGVSKTAYPAGNLNIGIEGDSQKFPFDGFIDEVRISKGIARWTDDFTPPAKENVQETILLRIIMNDSSEREYKLITSEVAAFVAWYNRPANTGNPSYTFTDTVDGSTEYLAFEKIISFKVLALAGK